MIDTGLLLAHSAARCRHLAQAVHAAGAHVVPVETPELFAGAVKKGPDFVVVDVPTGPAGPAHLEAYLGLAGTDLCSRAILLADLTSHEAFIELLEANMLQHLIARSAPESIDRLTLTLAMMQTDSPIGIERYVPWGTQIHGIAVTRSDAKDEVLSHLDEYGRAMAIPTRLLRLARTVGDEFLMNALYDAPVDKRGRRLFADRPRNEPVELPGDQAARFRFGVTGGALLVSILDPFGSLSASTVRENLLRTLSGGRDQIRSGTGGAGVGLYMAFEALSDWIIGVVPGRVTEMIGVIRTAGSYRDHMAMPKSLQVFVAGDG